jgi:ABC-type transport system involved in multi-copper enzyme maturation permease subunit
MPSPSAPPATDPAPAALVPEPPGRPRRVAAGWPLWRERLIGLAFLGAGLVLCLVTSRLTVVQQGALWAVLLLALALVMRLGWLPLFGPVLASDLIRTTRRGRYALLRGVYAVGLLLFILALYRVQPALDRTGWTGAGGMARFAETFCYTFLAVQFLAVVALTPAYAAGAIAEEKDRKTLEFLLATDVRDREIVLGKMASRVANLTLLVLTGLPILSLTQLWGGVDLGLLLAAFAATGLTLLSLASVSLLTSAYSRKAREAVVLAYLTAAGYVGLSVLAHLLNFFPRVVALPLTPGASPYTVKDLVDLFGAGNTGLAVLGLREDLQGGLTLQEALPARLSAYAAFHLLVAAVCTGWAVLRLRPLALLDGVVKATPRVKGRWWRFRWRPRPGRRALLWKEVWAEPGLSFNWFGKAILLLIVLASFVPAVWLAGALLLQHAQHGTGLSDWQAFGESVNAWVRVVGTLVACLTLLGVAVRAASSVSGERDRATFDSLLTAPVESSDLLFAKWLGSILSVRWAWLWLCLVWVLGSATGGLYGPTVPWLVLAWAVYAGFLAVLGLWFSMTCRTTLRATVGTLLTAAVLGVGHWYLWLVFCMPLRLREETFAWLVRFQMYGLTPPLALAWLAFRGDAVESGVIGTSGEDPIGALVCLVGGLVMWTAAGYFLWRRAVRRFRVLTGRVPVPMPAGMVPLAAPAPQPAAPAAASPPRPRRRKWVLIGLLGGAVLLAVGWGVYRGVSADRHLSDALAEVERADPGWGLPDIESGRKRLPYEENSGVIVLAVRASIPRGQNWPTKELTDRTYELPPQVRLDADDHRGITLDLEDVEEALLLVRPLADRPQGRYALNWSRDYIGTLLPHLDAHHLVRWLLWHDLMLRAEEDDPDGALADCRRLLNLGRSLGDEPLLVSQHVRNNAARSAVRGAQRVLAQGEPTDAALAELQRRFAEEEAHPGLLIGLRGERAGLDGLMARVQAGDFPWQELMRFLDPQERDEAGAADMLLFSLTPGAEKESRAALLRYNTAFIAAARLPTEEQGPALARLESQRQEMPMVARLLSPRSTLVGERFRTGRAELRCAVVALAAERFRRRHQRWPERLDELTPDFLDKVPADPFGGALLRLHRVPDGLIVYSVGPDGKDDGGVIQSVPDTNKTGPDLGFRLWDVHHRRQAPPPAMRAPP